MSLLLSSPFVPVDHARTELKSSSNKLSDMIDMAEDIDEDERCPICMAPFSERSREVSDCVVHPVQCEAKHCFHLGCLREWFSVNPVCPTCRKQMVICTGFQPEGGTFEIRNAPSRLGGHPDCGTIDIKMVLPPGTQSVDDPMPTTKYKGITTHAFLPDNQEGKELAKLLRIAFNRRLLFRMGWDSSTQRMNKLVWNGINVKTNRSEFPDPSYLNRLRIDLKEMGVQI